MDPDFAVVGGGIVGCAASAFLAEAGASVVLFEREDVGAAASGRNSGAVQHPFDPELTPLHWETLELYRRLGSKCEEFSLPDQPAGLLLLSRDGGQLAATAAGLRETVPELEARVLDEGELCEAEPALAPGLLACRLHTAYALPPASATHAFAELARRRGARIDVGCEARPWVEDGRARGVVVDGERVEAGAVLVAAGPWSIDLVDGVPVRPVWGLNVEVCLPDPPAHVLEQAGVEMADPSASAEAESPEEVPSLFSLVTVGAASTLGSTFLDDEPDPGFAEELRRRGAHFVPALAEAEIVSTRACARPQSSDGRPLVGAVPSVDRLFLCAGHGPWGISIGPATARLVADAMLDRGTEISPALRPGRFGQRGRIAAMPLAPDGSDITPAELQLAARNHGMPLELLREPITPVGLHYLLIHYDVPRVDVAAWRLEVGGEVERPLTLSLDDLRERPRVSLPVTMECAGNGRALLEPRPLSQPWLIEAVGTAEWTGTPLRGVLEEAGLADSAVEVLFTGLDRGVEGGVEQSYERSVPLADALGDDVLLAYEVNGQPLPPQHGFPLRLVVPGWYGMSNVKWLSRITVLSEPYDGYQQSWAYRYRQSEDDDGTPVTRMAPRALMAPPGIPDFMTRERFVQRGPVRLEGRAWSGWGPIERVEVTTDGGVTWEDAELGEPVSRAAWRGWSYEWRADDPGLYELSCRATDATGKEQPLDPAWNLGGYANNGVQRVAVHVT